jgi:hypothetical protein
LQGSLRNVIPVNGGKLTAVTKRKTKHASPFIAHFCQRALYRRRFGGTPAHHRRSGSIASLNINAVAENSTKPYDWTRTPFTFSVTLTANGKTNNQNSIYYHEHT